MKSSRRSSGKVSMMPPNIQPYQVELLGTKICCGWGERRRHPAVEVNIARDQVRWPTQIYIYIYIFKQINFQPDPELDIRSNLTPSHNFQMGGKKPPTRREIQHFLKKTSSFMVHFPGSYV